MLARLSRFSQKLNLKIWPFYTKILLKKKNANRVQVIAVKFKLAHFLSSFVGHDRKKFENHW